VSVLDTGPAAGAAGRPVIIKTTEHGPLRVKGPAILVDADGTPFTVHRKTFFLCRCGASRNKPFCDGSHKTIGFRAAERATVADTEPAASLGAR
jgi:CDGSH iron-sulfur domain-containing protein 3